MSSDVTGFVEYCKKRVKSNNGKIKELRNDIAEYETIIDVINRTDINSQILDSYREKIDRCLSKIDDYIQENKNHHDMLIVMKKVNKIIKK